MCAGALEGARRLLTGEVEDQVGGGEKPGGVAGENRLMPEVFRQHRFAQAVRGNQDHVLPFREKVEGEDAFDRGTATAGP